MMMYLWSAKIVLHLYFNQMSSYSLFDFNPAPLLLMLMLSTYSMSHNVRRIERLIVNAKRFSSDSMAFPLFFGWSISLRKFMILIDMPPLHQVFKVAYHYCMLP